MINIRWIFHRKEVTVEIVTGFFESVINAEFDFAAIWESILGVWAALTASPAYIEIKAFIDGLLSNVPAMAVTGVLLVLSLIQVFFGKKLLGFQKFIACFAVGFAYGVVFLAPFVDTVFQMPHWISGVVVGAIAALLCKLVYFLLYIGAAAYSVYFIAFSGTILPEVTAFTKDNMIYALIAAVVAVVLVLVLRKWIEMLGTSTLGAWCTFLCVDALAGLSTMEALASSYDIVKWVAIGVIALIGFIVQVKTRRRY